MSAYKSEISLKPEKLSGQALLETLYTASEWFDLLKTSIIPGSLYRANATDIGTSLCEELSALFDELTPGAYNLSGYPSDISYVSAHETISDVPCTISLGEPVKLVLGEILGVRENRHGKLAIEIAHPLAGFVSERDQSRLRAYVIPLEAITDITEVAYFGDLALMGERS
jgi:hypothetical protein